MASKISFTIATCTCHIARVTSSMLSVTGVYLEESSLGIPASSDCGFLLLEKDISCTVEVKHIVVLADELASRSVFHGSYRDVDTSNSHEVLSLTMLLI
jgi:hypothetical protein